jgi:hypothetical protein
MDDYNQQLKNDLKIIYKAAAEVNARESEKYVRARNKKASTSEFKVGQLVYLYFPQLKRPTGLKDTMCYMGPYSIVTMKRNKTAYCCSLATQNIVKCHVERLKPYYGTAIMEQKGESHFSPLTTDIPILDSSHTKNTITSHAGLPSFIRIRRFYSERKQKRKTL